MKLPFLTALLAFVFCAAYADFPNQKGGRLSLQFPEGFKIVESAQEKQDAGKGDVKFATAKDDDGHEIRAFHASHVPVSNEEIGKFVEATAAFYAKLQGVSVVSKKVENIGGRNWGRVSMKSGGRCIVMAFYSMDGSPTRLEFHGSADEEKKLQSFVNAVIERFGTPKEEANQSLDPTAPSGRGSP